MNNGICNITVDGTIIMLRFGIPANRQFYTAIEQRPEILVENKLNEVGIAVLLYSGYCNACLVNDEEQKLKAGAFVAYVENATIDTAVNTEMNAAVQCYTDSIYTEKFTEGIQNTLADIKKKALIGTGSKFIPTRPSSSPGKNTKPVLSGSSKSVKKRTKPSKKKR